MTTRSEKIEQIFQRVEEESARRAREAEKAEAEATQREAQDSVLSPIATVAQVKQRRRGSVSVSRFGQPTELAPEPIVSPVPPSTRPSRSSSIVITKPTFYSVQKQSHGSADSLASNDSMDDPSLHVEDEHQSTQMATIAGKQSISRAISRRLSRPRTRSRDVLVSATNSVIIDVAVEEATVEHDHDENELPGPRPQSSAAVYSGTLRPQRSSPGLRLNGEKLGWMSKAKDLTSKFKRRSMAALSQGSR